MNIGILGTGSIARTMAAEFAKVPAFHCAAVCSRQKATGEALAQSFGIPKVYTDLDAMLADPDIDLIYIATPNSLHYRQAKAALLAGKNVLCEKPFVPTVAEADELIGLAKERHLFLFEAITTAHHPNYALVKEHLPDIGPLRIVSCTFCQYSSRYDALLSGQVPPVFDPACCGGALMDLGVYNVSYVVGLFGSPHKVHYAANITRGIDTSGVLTMEYRSFKAVSINAKDSSSPARYIIQGTKGYLLQKSTANFCGGVTFHPYKGREEHFNLSAGRPRQAAEFHAFAKAIEGGDQELCSRMLDTSVAVSRVLTVARRSAGIKFPCDR